MGIELSDDAKIYFAGQNLTAKQIAEIEENAVSHDTAELVAEEAFALRSINFTSARIIDFACSAAPTDVVAKVIHDAGKLKRADLDNNQITGLAMHAHTEGEVDGILTLAQRAKAGGAQQMNALNSSLELIIPNQQNKAPSVVGAAGKDSDKVERS